MGDLVHHNFLSADDVSSFADSLVIDERSGFCWAYDPRDDQRRRLQDPQCEGSNCFDCSFTAGKCVWNPLNNHCGKLDTNGVDISGLRWWQWFEKCKDNEGFCDDNIHIVKMQGGGSLERGLFEGGELYFSIKKPAGKRSIPQNYYCSWTIDLDEELRY